MFHATDYKFKLKFAESNTDCYAGFEAKEIF